ncbi:MAG: type II secretion system F family protein [bacterium]|nr:type II secretion system F family protein [bacterium]
MKVSNISLSPNEKIGLISNLGTMLTAGIPIMDAVESLLEDSKSNVKIVLTRLRDDLAQGKRISASFSNFPKSFDRVTLNVLKASEEAGTLEAALKDIKISVQKEVEFNDKVKSAMIYPLVILLLFLAVLGVILVFVVPKIAVVFGRLKVPLPLPTQIMIALSDLIMNKTLYFAGGVILFFTIIIVLFKTQKQLIMSFIYSLPLISLLVREIDLTRFSRTLYLLLNAGLTITASLELAQDVVMRKKTQKIIGESREMVMTGKKLAEGMKKYKGEIPSIMIKLIEVGEKTGSLDKAMLDISEYLDYQVSGTLKTLIVLMEPLMLIVVGVFVGGMMMAIIAPMYGLIGQIGNR